MKSRGSLRDFGQEADDSGEVQISLPKPRMYRAVPHGQPGPLGNATQQHGTASRSLLYAMSAAFIAAALLAGISTVYAVHMGVEALSLLHDSQSSSTRQMLQGGFARASVMRADVSTGKASRKVADIGKQIQLGWTQRGNHASHYTAGDTLHGQRLENTGALGHNWSGRAGTGSSKDTRGQGTPLSRDDFVAALVTDVEHQELAIASRPWRQGVRTFVATNTSLTPGEQGKMAHYNEYWGSYPDDVPLRSLALKGDSRAALVPFLAHRKFGDTYKWLFYGDDDTMFFLDAAINVASDLDHNMPYFLTDHLWWTSRDNNTHRLHHPHPGAPRCVPCNYAKSTSAVPFKAPAGCPCTPQLLCSADEPGGKAFFKDKRGICGIPRVPITTFSMHGGAGALLSIGLMRSIDFEAFEDCVTTTYSTGGDAFISICLWEAGYGMTDPDPLWHPRGLSMFDVGRLSQMDNQEVVPRVAKVLGNHLMAAAGGCRTGLCKLERDHFVSLHMRSRKFPTREAWGVTAHTLTIVADLAEGRTTDLKLEDEEVAAAVRTAIKVLRSRSCSVPSVTTNSSTQSNSIQQFEVAIREEAQVKANEAVAAEVVRTIFRQASKPKPAPPPRAQGPSIARAPGPAPVLSPTKVSAALLVVDAAADSLAVKARAAQTAALAEIAAERGEKRSAEGE